MAKSLAQIEAQIAKLQKEATALKANQVASVLVKVKALIAANGLTAADLGFDSTALSAPMKAKRAVKVAAAGKKAAMVAGKPAKGKKVASPSAKPSKLKKAAPKPATGIGVIKYRDAAGNAWTGRGTRPKWFLATLASGKTAEQLQVQ